MTQLLARKYFIEFSRRESFKLYTTKFLSHSEVGDFLERDTLFVTWKRLKKIRGKVVFVDTTYM
jgi:hypothetical protein